MSQEGSEKLKCSKCGQFFSVDLFIRLSDTTKPWEKRRYGYLCFDCRTKRGKEYRNRPEVKQRRLEYQRTYDAANKVWRNVSNSQSHKQRAGYYKYLNEPCTRTPGCEKTLAHYGYCLIGGISQVPKERREYLQKYRREWKRRHYSPRGNGNRANKNHPWQLDNKLVFRRKLSGGNTAA
jgi:hypothetical protein